MDPHQSSAGGLTGITTDVLASREQMVFEWARTQGIPIAFVLAGGYLGRGLDRAGLVALHRLTIAAAAHYLSHPADHLRAGRRPAVDRTRTTAPHSSG
jgi:acetoin utilization deacetylase AcuC-like enzyme